MKKVLLLLHFLNLAGSYIFPSRWPNAIQKLFFPFYLTPSVVVRSNTINFHTTSNAVQQQFFFSKFVDERNFVFFFFGGNVDTAKRKRL